MKATRFELYEQAVQQLTAAAEALDQARATLKSIGIGETDLVSVKLSGARQTLGDVCHHAGGLIKDLKDTDCPECQHPASEHGGLSGCRHERGARYGIEGAPCGCGWWNEEAA